MMRFWCGVPLLLAACGRLHFDGAGSDAMDRDGESPDSPVPIDAAPACLTPGYSITVAASSHPYRLVAQLHTFRDAEQICEADGAHLATIDSALELDQLTTAVDMAPLPTSVASEIFVFIGLIQVAGAPVTDGWFDPLDRQVDASLWTSGEPNDSVGDERSGILRRGFPGITDYVQSPANVLCECDGIAVGPVFASTVANLP